jgi:hypothetical protein
MPDESFSDFYLRDCQEMASTLGFRLFQDYALLFRASDMRGGCFANRKGFYIDSTAQLVHPSIGSLIQQGI